MLLPFSFPIQAAVRVLPKFSGRQHLGFGAPRAKSGGKTALQNSLAAPQKRLSRKRFRGFTLVELLAVVTIIAISAALATPSLLRKMRDRRTQEVALRLSSTYRGAKMRSLGRGGAVMIRFDSSTQGRVAVFEARIDTGNGCFVPSPTCTGTNWAALGPSVAQIDGFDIATESQYDVNLGFSIVSPSGTPATLDVCFTPLGRTYARTAIGDPFVPMASIFQLDVRRGTGANTMGLERLVLLLPNGESRLQ